MRAFRSFYPPGAHYERRAQQILRKPALYMEEGRLEAWQQALLFEADGGLVAMAALDRDTTGVGHVAAVGVHRDWHGAYVEGTGSKLSRLLLSTCLQWLADDGYTFATALVHVGHARSKRLLEHLGFEFQSMDDFAHELHAVAL